MLSVSLEEKISMWDLEEVKQEKSRLIYFKQFLPIELQEVFDDRLIEYECMIQDESLKLLGGVII